MYLHSGRKKENHLCSVTSNQDINLTARRLLLLLVIRIWRGDLGG